jgi:hypothetical protein
MVALTPAVAQQIGHLFAGDFVFDDRSWTRLVTAVARTIDYDRLDEADLDNLRDIATFLYDRSDGLQKPFEIVSTPLEGGGMNLSAKS